MNLLEEIRSILEAAEIRHALIGALALAAYGVNRASVDLDLFAADPACLNPDLWAGLQSRGVAVQVRKGDLTDPLAGVVRFQAPGETPVDVVVGKFVWQTKLLERAEPVGGILVCEPPTWSSSSSTLEGFRTHGTCSSFWRGLSAAISSPRSNRAFRTFPCDAKAFGRRFCRADSPPAGRPQAALRRILPLDGAAFRP